MAAVNRPATKQQNDAANLYAGLLDEAMLRISSIEAAVSGRTGLHPAIVREFCYLQLRMLCEVIALGCLTAHGEIKATEASKLQKEFAADRIFRQLEELHPNFYPHPIRFLPAIGEIKFERLESGFLTKKELTELYHKGGDAVHRGSLKKLQASMKRTQPPNFGDIVGWTSKVIQLLTSHHIASFDNLTHFICVMKAADHGDRALVAIATSPLPK